MFAVLRSIEISGCVFNMSGSAVVIYATQMHSLLIRDSAIMGGHSAAIQLDDGANDVIISHVDIDGGAGGPGTEPAPNTRAVVVGGDNQRIRMDVLELSASSVGVEVYGMTQPGKNIRISHSAFVNVIMGVAVLDNSTVTVSDTLFNMTSVASINSKNECVE